MMGKFKVGDKVRRVEASIWPKQYGELGKEYTVLGFVPGDHLVIFEGCKGAAASSFELIPPPTFAIGDRVTLTVDNEGYGVKGDSGVVVGYVDEDIRVRFDHSIRGQHDWLVSDRRLIAAAEKWVPKVGDRVRVSRHLNCLGNTIHLGLAIGSTATVKERFEDSGWLLEGDDNFFYTDACLEPATLTIEAGRFYKTRDGRKVGPMEPSPWTEGFIDKSASITSQRWEKNGSFIAGQVGSLDLIALWQDEPAATNVGAQVDTIADEYGPFKASNDNEASSNITINISTDAEQTNEALDEIIRKLKKIRKLQREVGIAA